MDQEAILQFFAFDHLPPPLQEISEPFHRLAHNYVMALPRNPGTHGRPPKAARGEGRRRTREAVEVRAGCA
jgi:hypothetical protein